MKTTLRVSYYYIPHLDKPNYQNIEPGYLQVEIEASEGKHSRLVQKTFYFPLHLSDIACDFAFDVFIDPLTPWMPLDFMRYFINRERNYAQNMMPIPNYGNSELLMSTSFYSHYDSIDKEYVLEVGYYASDYGSQLEQKVEGIATKDNFGDKKERIIRKMFHYLLFKTVENIVDDEYFTFNYAFLFIIEVIFCRCYFNFLF